MKTRNKAIVLSVTGTPTQPPSQTVAQSDGIPVGEFQIISGTVVISDPCYALGTWCQGNLERVLIGKWASFVKIATKREFRGCVIELISRAVDGIPIVNAGWQREVSFMVGVDSGQAGIFDTAHYRDDKIAETVPRLSKEQICPDEPWYSLCCDRTLETKLHAGVIPYGVVSTSGIGDGSYHCYTRRDAQGHIVAIKIVFMDRYF
jgi:hypothetical protein